MVQKVCDYCGVAFHGRSDAKYCSPKHRVYARRAALAVDKQTVAVKKFIRGSDMLRQLKSFAPNSAAVASQLVLEHGEDCAEAAVKLALTAYSEAVGLPVPKKVRKVG